MRPPWGTPGERGGDRQREGQGLARTGGGVTGHVVAIKDVGDGRSLDGQGVLYAPLVQDLHKPVWQSEFVEASCGLVDAREGSGQLLTPFPEVAHLQPEERVRLATRGPLAG